MLSSLEMFQVPIRLQVLFSLFLAFECDCPSDSKVFNSGRITFQFRMNGYFRFDNGNPQHSPYNG